MAATLPRLYPILDAGLLAMAGLSVEGFARDLQAAGVRFLQYRDKNATDAEVLARAALLRSIFPGKVAAADNANRLILNDRVALCAPAAYDGVHLGQTDMHASQARQLLGPAVLLGVSTHNEPQLIRADAGHADYIAIGPIFATQSKANPDPVVGLPGLRTARRLTRKPLVAIGGITPANCRSVLDAGADSVAVISSLLPRDGHSTAKLVADFLAQIA